MPNFKTVSLTLAADVADAGTFTVAYPAGYDNGNFDIAGGHYMMVNGDRLNQPADIGIAFGDTEMTITNRTGAAIIKNDAFLTLNFAGKDSDLVADVKISDEIAAKKFVRARILNAVHVDLGSPAALDADGILVGGVATDSAQTYTAADLLVSELDVPRGLTVTGTAGSNHVITVTGKDEYDQVVVETLTLSGTNVIAGKKAFAKITTVAVAAGAASDTFVMGWTNVLGIPVFLPLAGYIVHEIQDGATGATAGTKVAGLARNTKSTATTADVRGTVIPNTACDGEVSYGLTLLLPEGYAIGSEQFAG